MSCGVIFWKGAVVGGVVLVMLVVVCLIVGVLLARDWRTDKRPEL